MGIFGGGYMKEGPGVSKDETKKKGFFLYWDIVFRKFTKLMGLNAMYMLTSAVYLVIAYVLLSTFIISGLGMDTLIESVSTGMASAEFTAEELSETLYFTLRSMITVLLFNNFGAGPISASYSYAARCYTRGEHTWLFSDGWDKFKENFKQGMIVAVIDILFIYLGMNAAAFYGALAEEMPGLQGTFFTFIRTFTLVMLFMYMMMHMYIYQIMVTYECKFGELMKSAAIMTIAKLPMNLLLTLLTSGIIILMFYFLSNPLVDIILYWIIGITFLKYPLEFYSSRVIEKNIKAVKKKQKKRQAKITYTEE